MAQDETFSVMSLNVDGLPGKIYSFDVNKDGPQMPGSERISKYLLKKDCDILCLQENFNYHAEILSLLVLAYNHDEWSGGIHPELMDIDFAHLQNLKFGCDGLTMLWKNAIESADYERVPWGKSFGKFSHDFDDMITKGFRRHDVTLPGGHEVVVYNMHMEASSRRDEQKHNDGKDREARLSQWTQLRDYILSHMDNRPVIVTGDMNSLYHRDAVKSEFIEAINASGKATCGDVWVETALGGIYPQLGGEAADGEALDKILYINPAEGEQIVPIAYESDKEGYLDDGKPLGDHYPIIATFRIDSNDPVGIEAAKTAAKEQVAYDLKGMKQNGQQHGIQIVGGKKVINR